MVCRCLEGRDRIGDNIVKLTSARRPSLAPLYVKLTRVGGIEPQQPRGFCQDAVLVCTVNVNQTAQVGSSIMHDNPIDMCHHRDITRLAAYC